MAEVGDAKARERGEDAIEVIGWSLVQILPLFCVLD